MSGRYSVSRVANSNDFPRLQRKVEDLYNNYNVISAIYWLSSLTFVFNLKSIIFFNFQVQLKHQQLLEGHGDH
jgi:hypothetical protein